MIVTYAQLKRSLFLPRSLQAPIQLRILTSNELTFTMSDILIDLPEGILRYLIWLIRAMEFVKQCLPLLETCNLHIVDMEDTNVELLFPLRTSF